MTTDNIKRKSIIPVSESSVLRSNILSRKFCEITSRGAKTIPAYEFLMEEADKINEKLNDLIDNDNEVGVDEVNNDQDANMNDNSENNVVQDERLPEEDFIEDPDIANSKGRPRQRYKTIREQIAEQESYHCSHCGRTDHTFPTCPFKHIEFDLPRKKKRKV
uniref:Protein FAR1-RELATED SEQUENCE n=1 Tax=Oryza glaberrima TaxID=4538 RepID=I1NTK2_ORYGL